jgi:hypothetical protein
MNGYLSEKIGRQAAQDHTDDELRRLHNRRGEATNKLIRLLKRGTKEFQALTVPEICLLHASKRFPDWWKEVTPTQLHSYRGKSNYDFTILKLLAVNNICRDFPTEDSSPPSEGEEDGQPNPINFRSIPSSVASRKTAKRKAKLAQTKADKIHWNLVVADDILRAELYSAKKAADQGLSYEAIPRATMSSQEPEQEAATGKGGKGKGKGKVSEPKKGAKKSEKPRTRCKLAALTTKTLRKAPTGGKPPKKPKAKKSTNQEAATIRQQENVIDKIKANVEQLEAGLEILRPVGGPKPGNKGYFKFINKTIEMNNIMFDNQGTDNYDEMNTILKKYMQMATKAIGSSEEATKMGPNTLKGLAFANKIFDGALEKLQGLSNPPVVEIDEDVLAFMREEGIEMDGKAEEWAATDDEADVKGEGSDDEDDEVVLMSDEEEEEEGDLFPEVTPKTVKSGKVVGANKKRTIGDVDEDEDGNEVAKPAAKTSKAPAKRGRKPTK